MKKLVRIEKSIPWLPHPSEGRLFLTDELPLPETSATAFGLAFDGSNILLTRLINRGWDIPGGVIEPGETPDQAAIREVWEETSVRIEIVDVIGIQELELFCNKPEGHRWPYPISVQICFLVKIIEISPFTPNQESRERGFFTPEEARRVPTMMNHIEIYEEALRKWMEAGKGSLQ